MLTSSHATALPQTPLSDVREQWVQLLPIGDFQGRDGRGPYSASDLNKIVENTRQYAGSTMLAVDYEHQIDRAQSNGQPAPAAGWIKGLQAKEDGLYGLIEWTERAAEKITAKEYKYISPVFMHDKNTGEVTRILRAALTNNPNLDMKALASTEDSAEKTTDTEDFIVQLKALLGLPDNTDFETTLLKIKELKSDPVEEMSYKNGYVPLGDFQKVAVELQSTRLKIKEDKTKEIVAKAITSGKLPPSMRDWAVSLCSQSIEQFEEFVEKMPQIVNVADDCSPSIHSGGRFKKSSALSEDQLAICKTLGHSPDEYTETMSTQD